MTVKTQRAKSTPASGPTTRHARRGGSGYAAEPPTMAEPSLRDMLKDPILLRLMHSDGVEPHQLLTLLDDARSRLFG
jgi:hypothetical protein